MISLTALTYSGTNKIMSMLLNENQITLAEKSSEKGNEWLEIRKQITEAAAEPVALIEGDSEARILEVFRNIMNAGGFALLP